MSGDQQRRVLATYHAWRVDIQSHFSHTHTYNMTTLSPHLHMEHEVLQVEPLFGHQPLQVCAHEGGVLEQTPMGLRLKGCRGLCSVRAVAGGWLALWPDILLGGNAGVHKRLGQEGLRGVQWQGGDVRRWRCLRL